MQTLIWNNLTQEEKRQALARPAQKVGESIKQAVDAIRENVAQNSDNALFELCEKFDKVKLTSLVVSPEEIAAASARISPALAQAIQQAKANIEAFHKAQQNQEIDIEPKPAYAAKSLPVRFPAWDYTFRAVQHHYSRRF